MRAVVIHAAGDLRVDDLPMQAIGPTQVRVRIAAGGICGSDLHYYRHGGFGAVRLKEPLVLGHEIAGTVIECGVDVRTVTTGQTVAVNPSLPCRLCTYCQRGMQNHCLEMRFYGSAMRFPHVQGGFREVLVCEEEQAIPVPAHVSASEAAFAEPLAVSLHAVRRAGSLVGKRVLVTGSGPIGALIVGAARRAGAAEIVITDIVDAPLAFASAMGADHVMNVAREAERLAGYERDKGLFDVMFEAAGSSQAVLSGLRVVRPGGVMVLVGNGPEAALPISAIVAKEIELRGTFRFHEEFRTAVSFIADRLIDVKPLLTSVFNVAEAQRAFELAADKSRSMKVQLEF